MKVRHIATITAADIQLLDAAVAALDVDETAGEALFLRTDRSGRHWLVEGGAGQVTIDLPGGTARQYVRDWLPLSERVRRFAVASPADSIKLSLVEDCTVLADDSVVSAAVDLVHTSSDERTAHEFVATAWAVVDLTAFRLALWSARCMPSGLGDTEYPMPPMWLQLGEGTVGLHVDWEDFISSRATYRVTADRGAGSATASIPHGLLAVFLETLSARPEEDEGTEITISVGTARVDDIDRPALTITGDGWRLLLWRRDPLVERWGQAIGTAIELAGARVVDRGSHDWALQANGTDVLVQLHHGNPDLVRVSAVLAAPVTESLELLREVSQLNASSTYVRFWVDEVAARVATDVRCTELASLHLAIRDVAAAAGSYAPMVAAIGIGG